MVGLLEDGNTRFMAIALVVLVVIGAVVLLWPKGGQPPVSGGNESALESEAAKILLSSFDRLQSTAGSDYQLEFTQDAAGLREKITLVSKGGRKLMIVSSPYDERRAYVFGNESYVCEKIEGKEMLCASTVNSTDLSDYALYAQAMFPDAVEARRGKKTDEFLITKGALLFSGKPEQKSANNISCAQVSYTISYANLSIGDLAQVNMRPDDPAVAIYKDYSFVQCIENSTGISAYTSLSYSAEGKTERFERSALSISTSPSASLDVPVALSSRRKVEPYFAEASGIGAGLIKCVRKEEGERDSCYSSLAFSSGTAGFCDYVKGETKHDQCLIASLAHSQEASACEKATLLKDECWFELAVRAYENDFCSRIGNASLSESCMGSVNESAKPTPPPPQCTKDSDCKRAGCSGQLCVPQSSPDTITTCEYRDVYACYGYTSCGCFEGRCSWDQTDPYLSCIEAYEEQENKRTLDEIYGNVNTTSGGSSNASSNSTE